MYDQETFLGDYQLVAASATAQVLAGQGGAGAKGDILKALIIIPLTTGAGDVSIKDGSGSSMTLFKAGTLADLKPHVIPLGSRSVNGAWSVTTGANVQVMALGRFQ